MNYKQRIGLIIFLSGAFGKVEWHIKGSDDRVSLIIFMAAIFAGILIFVIAGEE